MRYLEGIRRIFVVLAVIAAAFTGYATWHYNPPTERCAGLAERVARDPEWYYRPFMTDPYVLEQCQSPSDRWLMSLAAGAAAAALIWASWIILRWVIRGFVAVSDEPAEGTKAPPATPAEK